MKSNFTDNNLVKMEKCHGDAQKLKTHVTFHEYNAQCQCKNPATR